MATTSARVPSLVPNERTSLIDTLTAFAAGAAVPGSGSANALGAAIAAAVTASVAVKTVSHGDDLKYRAVSGTAETIARRSRKLGNELLSLVERDAEVFATVIAFRLEGKSLGDKYRQDQVLRQEIGAMKDAIEIPLRIADLAIEVATMAEVMLDHGFRPAQGESYSAFVGAVASVDGSLFVAQMNIRGVKRKVLELDDAGYETPWLKKMESGTRATTAAIRKLHKRQQELRKRFGVPARIQRAKSQA
jgi:formiminotetrahydrofolate cyclodeaminase